MLPTPPRFQQYEGMWCSVSFVRTHDISDWQQLTAFGRPTRRGPWTSAEDDRLRKIAAKWQERCWDEVSLELRSGRSAFQCARRYWGHLVHRYRHGSFTQKEDDLLMRLVEACSNGDSIPWAQVGRFVGQPIGGSQVCTENERFKIHPWHVGTQGTPTNRQHKERTCNDEAAKLRLSAIGRDGGKQKHVGAFIYLFIAKSVTEGCDEK